MKAIIETMSPGGYVVRVEVEADELMGLLSNMQAVEQTLALLGYEPTGQQPLTPDGLPICRKHRMVMFRREKQGDEWFSHKMLVGGQELYCKGRPGPDSPGWEY